MSSIGGGGLVNERTARHCFQNFRSVDLSLSDEPLSGCPHCLNDETLQAAIEEDCNLTCIEVARQLIVFDESFIIHLRLLGKT